MQMPLPHHCSQGTDAPSPLPRLGDSQSCNRQNHEQKNGLGTAPRRVVCWAGRAAAPVCGAGAGGALWRERPAAPLARRRNGAALAAITLHARVLPLPPPLRAPRVLPLPPPPPRARRPRDAAIAAAAARSPVPPPLRARAHYVPPLPPPAPVRCRCTKQAILLAGRQVAARPALGETDFLHALFCRCADDHQKRGGSGWGHGAQPLLLL